MSLHRQAKRLGLLSDKQARFLEIDVQTQSGGFSKVDYITLTEPHMCEIPPVNVNLEEDTHNGSEGVSFGI